MQPELSHAQIQQGFRDALGGESPPAGLSAPDQSEVAQRFKVYRNNVFHSLTRALAARFPVVEQLVGPEFFSAMARAYITASPPKGPVMLLWGESFAAFLDAFQPVAHLPFLADVARLEYARGLSCHAADASTIPPEMLADPDLEARHLALHPSVTMFKSATPAVQIWRRHQPGHAQHPLTHGPDYALIARRPDFTIIVEPVDTGTFSVLASLQDGASLGHAATLSDPTPALTLLLRHGLITDAQKGPTA